MFLYIQEYKKAKEIKIMGMAASQARVLLLTARTSDLELRAMSITNAKMLMSMQTEEIASKYSTAVSNREILFNWGIDPLSGEQTQVDLTYDQLISSNSSSVSPNFRVVTGDGSLLVSSLDDAPLSENNYDVYQTSQKLIYSGGKFYDKDTKQEVTPTNQTLVPLSDGSYVINDSTSSDNGKKVYINSMLKNKDTFQQALMIGSIYIEQEGTTTEEDSEDGSGTTGTGKWSRITWSSSSAFSEQYDTSDDAAAEAEYETQLARIQAKEKKLDNDLKLIETQQKACQTEIDSVKEILKKHIESFKVFSG